MAPERTARPGALSLPGIRNSALASAALTSVALLAQTANATPSVGDEAPSREEVSRRVSSLYDQAESDTGTFNATRAAASGPRARAERATGTGRRPAAARDEAAGRGDPALDSVTRRWYDAARSKIGPTVPAALPRDRMPDRPIGTRQARPAEGAVADFTDLGGAASDRPALSPAGAPVAELMPAPATGAAAVAELTAGPVAALPAAESTGTALALPAPAAEVTAEPRQQTSLRATKERNQRKIERARALLSAYTTRQNAPLAMPETQPTPPLPADTWDTMSTPAVPADVWTTTSTSATPADTWDTGSVPAGNTWDTTSIPATEAWTTTPAPATDTWTTTPAPAADTWTSAPAPATDTWDTTSTPTADTWTTASTPAPAQSPADTQWQALQDLRSADLASAVPADTTASPGTAGGTVETPAATTSAPTAPRDTRAVRALEFARAQLGKPCVWGTTGPDAYDGAGLTQAAWKAAGITLPRTPQEQATAGRGIALAHAEPGDLVLFHAGHVGICSGNGMMIHAPGPGAVIREESVHYAGEAAIHSVVRPA